MNAFAEGIHRFFDLLIAPLAPWPALAMITVSVLTAIWALLLFKWTTPQKKLSIGRDRLFGHIYELGLYQDHLNVMGRIQRDLAAANFRYLLLTLPALIALTVPMVVTLAQLDSRFSHRPLQAGEGTVFTVGLAADAAIEPGELELRAPAGVVIEAGPVPDHRERAAAWRLRVEAPGDHLLQVLHGDRVLAERVLPANEGLPRINEESRRGALASILAPGAPPLSTDGTVVAMTLQLPSRSTSYAGLELNWLVAFMGFSLLGGLLLKDALRVSI